jgi:hypothetical protein
MRWVQDGTEYNAGEALAIADSGKDRYGDKPEYTLYKGSSYDEYWAVLSSPWARAHSGQPWWTRAATGDQRYGPQPSVSTRVRTQAKAYLASRTGE